MAQGRGRHTRREFVKGSMAVAAAVAAGAARVLGANDRVVLASIGIRGQGDALKRGFARLPGVEIKTLCDVDENLVRVAGRRPATRRTSPPSGPATCRTCAASSTTRTSTASSSPPRTTGTRSPPSGPSRPASTSTSRSPPPTPCGRAARWWRRRAKYKKVVQVGTMNRSRPAVRAAIQFIQEGGMGKVYMARGLCFKPRPSIGQYPDGPLQAGEKYKLNVESKAGRARVGQRLSRQGQLRPLARARRPCAPSTATASTTTGTGTGTTATATRATRGRTSSTSPAGAWARTSTRCKVRSTGGYFGEPSSQETPDLQTSLFEYADGKVLEFGTRGGFTNDEGTPAHRQPLLWDEGMALDRRRRAGAGSPTSDARTRRGPGSEAPRDGRQRPRRCSPASRRPTTRTSSTPCARATRRSSTATSWRVTCPRPCPSSPTSPTGSGAACSFDGKAETDRGRRRGQPAPDPRVPQALRGAREGLRRGSGVAARRSLPDRRCAPWPLHRPGRWA